MKKFYFLLVILFIQYNSQIKQNPIFLVESIEPFVLSAGDNCCYVMTLGEDLRVNEESGVREDISGDGAVRENYIFVAGDSYDSWVYYSKAYFKIIYDPFLSYDEFEIEQNSEYQHLESVGCISKYNVDEIIIYGYYQNDFLVFSTGLGPYAIREIPNIKGNKLICTFIQSEDYTCGLIMDNTLTIYCLKYHINPSNSQENTLEIYTNNEDNTLKDDYFCIWLI